jgi:hypothetical protein
MKKKCMLSVIALVGAAIPLAVSADEIVYSIVNNPAVQNGYALSGTITTDGKTGMIQPADVLAWDFLATDGVHTFSANSTELASSVGMGVSGILATTDYLALPSSTVSDPYGFWLAVWTPGAASLVQWTGSTLENGAFTSASMANGSWSWWQDFITTTPHDVPGGWAIAVKRGTNIPDVGSTSGMLWLSLSALGFASRKLRGFAA